MVTATTSDLKKTVKDSAYVAIGIGVMGFQQAQSRQLELRSQVQAKTRDLSTQARDAFTTAEVVSETVRNRIEPMLAQVQTLPDQIAHAVAPAVEAGINKITSLKR